jgi:hypothetical protein
LVLPIEQEKTRLLMLPSPEKEKQQMPFWRRLFQGT